MEKIARHVIMVSPDYFEYNTEAAESNSFQNKSELTHAELVSKVQLEFEKAVEQLKAVGVKVTVYNSLPNTPDSVFPNNWFSTHANGKMFVYPMANANRRLERNPIIIRDLAIKYKYNIVDFSSYEDQNEFLEGTGSLVFDHYSKVVYAALSQRTNERLLEMIASTLGYKSIIFKTYGKQNELIYHTNVMLTIGDQFAVVGLDTIDSEDREKVKQELIHSEKELIELTNDQVFNHFAGNMMQLANNNNETVIVLSTSAYQSLTEKQIELLNKHNKHICTLDIPILEHVGGGSARCMIAEIYQPTN